MSSIQFPSIQKHSIAFNLILFIFLFELFEDFHKWILYNELFKKIGFYAANTSLAFFFAMRSLRSMSRRSRSHSFIRKR